MFQPAKSDESFLKMGTPIVGLRLFPPKSQIENGSRRLKRETYTFTKSIKVSSCNLGANRICQIQPQKKAQYKKYM